MTLGKRIGDVLFALFLLVILSPFGVSVALAIWLLDGRPILYAGERMRAPGEKFRLLKFRTMRPDPADQGVSGGDKAHRITRTGAFLRRTRLDEFPQLLNILKGDISFVGPRPELERYVEMFPELFADVLESRPGVTGLATLAYHRTEERLLAACTTPEQTEEIYVRRCLPAKARLDLIYQKNRNICYDALLVAATALRFVPLRLFRKRASR